MPHLYKMSKWSSIYRQRLFPNLNLIPQEHAHKTYKLRLPVFLAFTSQPLLSHTIHLAEDTRNTHLFSECPHDWTVTLNQTNLFISIFFWISAYEQSHGRKPPCINTPQLCVEPVQHSLQSVSSKKSLVFHYKHRRL